MREAERQPARHEDDLLRPDDVAREYLLGRDRVMRLVNAGELPALRLGRRMLIPRREVRRWIERQVAGQTKPEA